MKIRWGRWRAGILVAAMLFAAVPQAEAAESVPKEIYQWVQSTSRQNYYFNKQQIYFGADEKGNLDLDSVLVPVLKIYDSVQIHDVVSKRRWKSLSTAGYGDLTGCAEYLKFNLREGTVQITRHEDLDSGWGTLEMTTSDTIKKISDFSEKDVDGRFYRGILNYIAENKAEIAARTQTVKNYKLTDKAKKQLHRENEAKKHAEKKEKTHH